MAKPPAFQFYPADWIISTRTVPLEARAVHIDLLCHAWTEEGLPANLEGLHILVGLSRRRFSALWEQHLAHRWQEQDGRLVNPRQEVERAKQQAWREKSAKGGRAKAQANGSHP
jgi:uncharacterized protein YdaU (DUF1376 family)